MAIYCYGYASLYDELLKLEAENHRLNAAIRWALGGKDSDFRARAEGEGAYWWRKELRERAYAKKRRTN